MTRTPRPVVPGWFDQEAADFRLLGTRCRACGAVFFPREDAFCRNPVCGGEELVEVRLSRRGTVWSHTDARYRPPAPYVSDPEAEWRPYTLVAVELAEERMVVLGQAAPGVRAADLAVGTEVELVPGTLAEDDRHVWTTWHWRPCGREDCGVAESAPPAGCEATHDAPRAVAAAVADADADGDAAGTVTVGPRAETASLHPPTPRRGWAAGKPRGGGRQVEPQGEVGDRESPNGRWATGEPPGAVLTAANPRGHNQHPPTPPHPPRRDNPRATRRATSHLGGRPHRTPTEQPQPLSGRPHGAPTTAAPPAPLPPPTAPPTAAPPVPPPPAGGSGGGRWGGRWRRGPRRPRRPVR